MKFAVFSNIHSAKGGGGTANIAAWSAALQPFADVDLYTRRPIERKDLAAAYGIELDGVRIQGPDEQGADESGFWGRMRRGFLDRHYDLVIRQGTAVPGPTACRHGVLLTEFPFQSRLSRREHAYLNTYSNVVAISSFTATWVRRRWGRECQMVPPPVGQIATLPKKPIIAAAGRFTSGRRGKYQLEMVQAFREISPGLAGGWELHLCGFAETPEYVDQVRQAAAGLPVHFHLNCSRAEVEEVLGQATIFWHATGVAFEEKENPDLMEHFGISVAEAMSAGCAPVVVGRGGLPEVVGSELAEWTWQTWDECIAKTKALLQSPDRLPAISRQAKEQAATFSFSMFRERVAAFVGQLTAPGNGGAEEP